MLPSRFWKAGLFSAPYSLSSYSALGRLAGAGFEAAWFGRAPGLAGACCMTRARADRVRRRVGLKGFVRMTFLGYFG